MTETRDENTLSSPLYEKLTAYGEADYCGFHMPGHKRHMGDMVSPFRIDITEIDGFDDLHHPKEQGILVQAQERAARLYKAEETHFLVNGSTAGVLSAISACVHPGGELLLARNSHKSAYHGAGLRGLKVWYLYPQILKSPGINGGILPSDVENALAEHRGIRAVFVTSPTYEGVCLDVRAVAEICHRRGVPLIVDQAHGAHFPFSGYFPEDALSAGADIVIQSVHKTLPALTQTALLHIQGRLADRERLRYYLSVYQTSSPSYVLMASIDNCMEQLKRQGKELFAAYVERLERFRNSCADLKKLGLMGKECIGKAGIWDFDCSRLVISVPKGGISGYEILKRLRLEYHIQMEMAADSYVTGISGAADREEDFERLGYALHQIEYSLEEESGRMQNPDEEESAGQAALAAPSAMTLGRALEQEKEWLERKHCLGRISAAYLYLYPPGIPLAVPGEILTEGICRKIEAGIRMGQELHGLDGDGRIAVLSEFPHKMRGNTSQNSDV